MIAKVSAISHLSHFVVNLLCWNAWPLNNDTHGGKGAQVIKCELPLMARDAVLCRTQVEFPPRFALT
jgi:hypothetical protein